jgi:ribose 5-phosphate isomerase B
MISDAELKALVGNVVRRTMHGDETRTETQRPEVSASVGKKKVALGADHGGFKMKEMLKAHLTEAGFDTVDCGAHSAQSVDYPDLALCVAEKVSRKEVCCGIIVDGAGIGSCMTANKVPGVRAAMCYDYATAVNSREHNHANVLTLGAGLIGDNLAKQIVDIWLATDFGGERHAKRVDKITAVEKKYSKTGN